MPSTKLRRRGLFGLLPLGLLPACGNARASSDSNDTKPIVGATGRPLIVSTWEHGMAANDAAMKVLAAGGTALDAAEAGVRVSESDPAVDSVGKGGLPNRDGIVQLDACIMDGPTARAGAVAGLEGIENPISVARLVMEKTPHVLVVGEGAKAFALENGFEERDLLTDYARHRWEEWKTSSGGPEGHDTIGLCVMDSSGALAVAVTTSGLAYKLPGRVGDSPLPGAGGFVDQVVGAAAATGIGEEVIQTCGSFLVVENMRRGMSPDEACEDAVRRILSKHPDMRSEQIAYVALRADGETGAFSVKEGFEWARHDSSGGKLETSRFVHADPGWREHKEANERARQRFEAGERG